MACLSGNLCLEVQLVLPRHGPAYSVIRPGLTTPTVLTSHCYLNIWQSGYGSLPYDTSTALYTLGQMANPLHCMASWIQSIEAKFYSITSHAPEHVACGGGGACEEAD